MESHGLPLTDLSVDQVVALLAKWNLDKELGNEFRAQNIDGGCLAEIEEGDFKLSDFKKAKRFHLKKFWKCLEKAKAGNVVLQTTTAMAAAPPLPTAAAVPVSCAVSSRFVGHYDARDSSKGRKIIGPIYGLKAQQVTNLYRAFAKIKATYAADKVPYPPEFEMLRVNIYVAKQFVDTNWNKIQLKYPRITKAQAAAINFYTQETPFYPYLNRKLREKNRHAVTRLFPFLKLLLSALYCLPLAGGNGSINVKRGVKLKLAPQFPTGSKTVWWSINSTTQNISVLQSSKFLGSFGPRTIFDITARSLVSVKHFSALDEDELILLPGTQLEVMGVLEQGDLDIVQLQEPIPVVPMLDFAHPSLLTGYSVAAGKQSAIKPQIKLKLGTNGITPKQSVFKAKTIPKHLPPGCKVMWTKSNSKWPKGVIGTVFGPHASKPDRLVVNVWGNRFGILKEELERAWTEAERKATAQMKQKKLSKASGKWKGVTIKSYIEKFSSGLQARGDDDILSLLHYTLIPNASKTTEKVAYLKDVGDYFRYVAEHAEHLDERQTAANKAKTFYKEAIETGKCGCGVDTEKLSDAHPILLGTKLNLVVLMHDILNQPESACKDVQKDFDLALDKLIELPQEEYRDAKKILEVMRENWHEWFRKQSQC